MLAGLRFFEQDTLFALGAVIIERTNGLPMGAPLSPPLTCCDLDLSIHKVRTSPEQQKRSGWYRRHTTFDQLVAGILHVDDALLYSRQLCCDCLFDGLRKNTPADVGLTLEDRSDQGTKSFDFLHHRSEWPTDFSSITVAPLQRNLAYATGEEQYQKNAKCQLWLSARVQNSSQLRPFMLAKLSSFGHTFDGAARHPGAAHALAVLLSEIIQLRWPLPWLARLLRSYDVAYRTSFCHLVRLVEKVLDGDMALQHAVQTNSPGATIFAECLRVCQCAQTTMRM
jgi:hypothetical protein